MSAVVWSTDDDMVDEGEAHGVGGFGEIFGEGFVGNTGGGFSGGMIVGDREIGSLVNEDGAEDFGNGGDSLIGRTAGEFAHTDEFTISVQGQNEEFLG